VGRASRPVPVRDPRRGGDLHPGGGERRLHGPARSRRARLPVLSP
jgi:hypothetical protein